MLIKASYLILATVFFAATWFVPALSNYASGAAVLTGALFSWFLKNPFQEHSHRLVPTFLGLAIVGTIAEILGARLVLENRAPLPGLRAALVFSLGQAPDGAPRHENGEF